MDAGADATVVEGHVVERKKRGRLRKYVVYAVEIAAGVRAARRPRASSPGPSCG